jgi:hypothetical protein
LWLQFPYVSARVGHEVGKAMSSLTSTANFFSFFEPLMLAQILLSHIPVLITAFFFFKIILLRQVAGTCLLQSATAVSPYINSNEFGQFTEVASSA